MYEIGGIPREENATLAFCYFCDQFYEIVLCWFRHA